MTGAAFPGLAAAAAAAPPGRATVEAALACLRASMGVSGGVSAGEVAGAGAGAGVRVPALIAFGEEHGVAEALCAGLIALRGPALAPLLAPVREARARRSAAQAARLAEVAEALAGLDPVALKGAAWLAEAGGPAPWREMVDLDLLIPEPALPEAVARLRARGWTGETEAHSAATDYHHPALLPPAGRGGASVELHVRLGWGDRLAAGVRARAVPSAAPGLAIPSPEDRLAHLIRHAQLSDRGWRRRTVRLRDALDWARLAPRADRDAARARVGHPRAAEAFETLMARILAAPPPPFADRHADWAEAALEGLADPAARAGDLRRDRLRAALEAAATPALLRHALAGLAIPARRRRFLGRLTGR